MAIQFSTTVDILLTGDDVFTVEDLEVTLVLYRPITGEVKFYGLKDKRYWRHVEPVYSQIPTHIREALAKYPTGPVD